MKIFESKSRAYSFLYHLINAKLFEYSKKIALIPEHILCLNISDEIVFLLKKFYPSAKISSIQLADLKNSQIPTEMTVDLMIANIALAYQDFDLSELIENLKKVLPIKKRLLFATWDHAGKLLIEKYNKQLADQEIVDEKQALAELESVEAVEFISFKEPLLQLDQPDKFIDCHIFIILPQETLKYTLTPGLNEKGEPANHPNLQSIQGAEINFPSVDKDNNFLSDSDENLVQTEKDHDEHIEQVETQKILEDVFELESKQAVEQETFFTEEIHLEELQAYDDMQKEDLLLVDDASKQKEDSLEFGYDGKIYDNDSPAFEPQPPQLDDNMSLQFEEGYESSFEAQKFEGSRFDEDYSQKLENGFDQFHEDEPKTFVNSLEQVLEVDAKGFEENLEQARADDSNLFEESLEHAPDAALPMSFEENFELAHEGDPLTAEENLEQAHEGDPLSAEENLEQAYEGDPMPVEENLEQFYEGNPISFEVNPEQTQEGDPISFEENLEQVHEVQESLELTHEGDPIFFEESPDLTHDDDPNAFEERLEQTHEGYLEAFDQEQDKDPQLFEDSFEQNTSSDLQVFEDSLEQTHDGEPLVSEDGAEQTHADDLQTFDDDVEQPYEKDNLDQTSVNDSVFDDGDEIQNDVQTQTPDNLELTEDDSQMLDDVPEQLDENEPQTFEENDETETHSYDEEYEQTLAEETQPSEESEPTFNKEAENEIELDEEPEPKPDEENEFDQIISEQDDLTFEYEENTLAAEVDQSELFLEKIINQAELEPNHDMESKEADTEKNAVQIDSNRVYDIFFKADELPEKRNSETELENIYLAKHNNQIKDESEVMEDEDNDSGELDSSEGSSEEDADQDTTLTYVKFIKK